MTVLVKDATGTASKEIIHRARKWGFGFDASGLEKAATVVDAYILTANKIGDISTIRIVSPGMLWVFNTSYYPLPYHTGSRSFAPQGYLSIPAKAILPATGDSSAIDEMTYDINEQISFPKRSGFKYGNFSTDYSDSNFLLSGQMVPYGPGVMSTDVFYLTTEDIRNGWKGQCYIGATQISGNSSYIHTVLRDGEDTKTFSRAITNWRVFAMDGSLFGDTININPFEAMPSEIYNAPLSYMAPIKEIVQETVNGDLQPLRYSDFVVACITMKGTAPNNIDRLRYDGNGDDTEYAQILGGVFNSAGISFARIHAPYDKSLSGFDNEPTVQWTRTITMLESDIAGVPPEDKDYDYTVYDTDPPEGITIAGLASHGIIGMSCAIREPENNRASQPVNAVPIGEDPAQLVCVVTSYTVGEGYDGFCVSARAYTVDLATGATQETDIATTVTQNSGGPGEEEYGEFDACIPYASAGQAVPIVRFTAIASLDLIDFTDTQTDPPGPFPGQEAPGSTSLSLVYAGGITVDHDLSGYCPPRPIMRGGTWRAYAYGGFCQFGYDTNIPGSESMTVWVDSPDRSTDDSGITWLDSGRLDTNTYRRTVSPNRASLQRICVNMGGGFIATLAAPTGQVNNGVTLDWTLVVTREINGQFVEIRGIAFEALPLESSNWLSLNVITPATADENGNEVTPAVLIAGVSTPTEYLQLLGYGRAYMHEIHSINNNYPRPVNWQQDLPGQPLDNLVMAQTKISRDGGRTWDVLFNDVGSEVYNVGNVLKPNYFMG